MITIKNLHKAFGDHQVLNGVDLEINTGESLVILGGVALSAEQANAMIGRGFRALALGFDWSLLQRGIVSSLEGVER